CISYITLTILSLILLSLFFFFNDTATTEIYTLSLHDALPISYEKAILSEIDSGRSVRVHASFAARSGIAEDEDHARTGLCAHQPEPTVQSGRYGGDHRDRRGNHRYWRRRFSRCTETVCRAADRAGPAAYRTAVAGHVAVVLLSSWARKRTCARRARSCAVGHQRQGAETAGSRNPGWHGAELLRVLQH